MSVTTCIIVLQLNGKRPMHFDIEIPESESNDSGLRLAIVKYKNLSIDADTLRLYESDEDECRKFRLTSTVIAAEPGKLLLGGKITNGYYFCQEDLQGQHNQSISWASVDVSTPSINQSLLISNQLD